MPWNTGSTKVHLNKAFTMTMNAFASLLPVIIGMMLLTGLIVQFLPSDKLASLFDNTPFLDALTGAVIGSVSAGHPISSYVLGGELLSAGVSLIAVTALIVSWVTVGSIQLPAEALMLGRRFAIYRNVLCFVSAILIAWLTIATLTLLGYTT